MSAKKSSSNGIGFGGLLTLIFITLKLCKVIGWSWRWVLSPIWIAVAIVLFLLMIAGIIAIYQAQKESKQQSNLSRWGQRMKEMEEQKKRQSL